MIELKLPWPPRELSPNARIHWTKRSKAAKSYRGVCYALTRQSRVDVIGARILLDLEFVPPDRRRRDDDNMLASFKAGRDGLAEALGIDDSRFVTQLRVSRETVSGGAVRVRISRFEEGEAA